MAQQKHSMDYIDDRAQEEYIIDCDFHLQMEVEDLFKYVKDDSIRTTLETNGPPPQVRSGWGGYGSGEGKGGATAHGRAVDWGEIGEVCDGLGIDEAVVTPGTNLPFVSAKYPELKSALVSAYNDYLIENVINLDENIYATMAIQKWDAERAREELDRIGTNPGIVGVQSWFSQMAPWGQTRHDPILERMVDHELPLLIHPGAHSTGRFDLISDSMQTHTELLVAGLGHTVQAYVMNMIMTGVFDKFPELDLLVQEGGTGWIPAVADRADEIYQIAPHDVKLTPRMQELGNEYLEKMPSEYIVEDMYVSTQPIALPDRSDLLEAKLKICRADRMFMFSTDWPHGSVDLPNWLYETTKIDDADRKKILHENAQDFFRLPS